MNYGWFCYYIYILIFYFLYKFLDNPVFDMILLQFVHHLYILYYLLSYYLHMFFICNKIKPLPISILHFFLWPFIDVYSECSKIISLLTLNVRNFSFINFPYTNSPRIVFKILITFLCCDSLLLINVFWGSFVFCGSFVCCD